MRGPIDDCLNAHLIRLSKRKHIELERLIWLCLRQNGIRTKPDLEAKRAPRKAKD